MTSYDEQDGFRRKSQEKDFRIRKTAKAPAARTSGWSLLDQVAGERTVDRESNVSPHARPEIVTPVRSRTPAPAEPMVATQRGAAQRSAAQHEEVASTPVFTQDAGRFDNFLSRNKSTEVETSDAHNGTPLKALLKNIAQTRLQGSQEGSWDTWR